MNVPAAFTVVSGRTGRLQLLGELDAVAVPAVWARLEGVDGDVALDCAGLTFIDASGVRLFVALHAACRSRGARLSIVDPSRCVLRLLDVTGLAAALDVRVDCPAP